MGADFLFISFKSVDRRGVELKKDFTDTDHTTPPKRIPSLLSYATDDLPGGVYFLHIAKPNGTTIQKMMLVK